MGQRDDGAAMLIAIFVIVAVTVLSTAVAGMVVEQVGPTKQIAARVNALHAADAGIDVALTMMRTAPSADGSIWNLPCHPTASPLHGEVGSDDSQTFSVSFDYHAEDGAAATCTGRAARYVDVTSTGVVTASGTTVSQRRVLHQRYYLRVTDTQILGGVIKSINDQTKCMKLVSSAVGSRVTLERCDDADPLQRFAYNKNYTLSVAGPASSNSQCLTLGTAKVGGNPVVQTALCSDDLSQKWGVGSAPDFYLTQPYRCLRTSDGSQNTGMTMVGVGCAPYNSTTFGWSPDPAIGPGSITVDDDSGDLHNRTLQWVDYQEFGRCLDVTNEDVNWGFLMNYPCKQDPSGVPAKWNQRFTWNSDDALETSAPQGRYCITSRSAGGRVFMSPCDRSTAQRWTVTRASNVFDRYTVKDAWGHCLAPNAADIYANAFSVEWARACDGSAVQKWNAPGLTQESDLYNLHETDPNS